jgi:hypothetical protein
MAIRYVLECVVPMTSMLIPLQLIGRAIQNVPVRSDQKHLDVIAAEFLPDGKQLFIISADGDGTLHVLQ